MMGVALETIVGMNAM